MIQPRPHHQVVVIAEFAAVKPAVEFDGGVAIPLLVGPQALAQFIKSQALWFEHIPAPLAQNEWGIIPRSPVNDHENQGNFGDRLEQNRGSGLRIAERPGNIESSRGWEAHTGRFSQPPDSETLGSQQ